LGQDFWEKKMMDNGGNRVMGGEGEGKFWGEEM